ncbi:MAG TPA: glycosyltransferase family 39 protein [Myxococcales bacterium LLY-WYZ-16_1]|nr:glycosyltransferase family 39 protein [Myxococcales bacterium LLY-WYZ-16_1]
MTERSRRRAAFWAALALAALHFVVLWVTAPSIGFVRDEGYYFKAAEQYFEWFEAFGEHGFGALSDSVIRKHFEYNSEHPAFPKLVQGGFHALLHETLGVADAAQGFRAAGFFFAALALLGTFALGLELYGAAVGWVAAAGLATMPRFFFDAHLATFDVPMTAAWVWSLWAFLRAWRQPSRGRVGLAGLVFGLALSTKLNAFFLPFVFAAVWLAEPPEALRVRRRPGPSGTVDWVLPGLPGPLVSVGLLGIAVFFAAWPYLWPDPVNRFGAYLRFHLGHEHYPISYFGELWVQPPFPLSFPWVMTALTVPAPWLVLGAFGLLRSAFRRWNGATAVLVVGTFLPIAVIGLPNTPIFGGTKHWYTALPTLCVVAAALGLRGAQALKSRAKIPVALSVIVWLAPGVAGAVRTHPFGIAYYNALAGGVRGAAELGMQRAFWGTVNRPLLPELVQRVPKGRVFFNRTNYDAYRMYRRVGVLPERGLRYASDARFAKAAFHFEQPEHGEAEAEIWSTLGTRPVAGVYLDNVTLAQLYVKGLSDRPPSVAPTSTSTPAVP